MTTQTLPSPVRRVPKPGNSVAELFPGLVSRWDSNANAPLTPADVSRASSRVVYWTCDRDKNHPSFKARVYNITRGLKDGIQRFNGCPLCAHASLSAPKPGRKSLAEEFPEVARLWDYKANYPLTPEQVAPRSNKKAWFICPEHGSQFSYISNRTAGNGCKLCGNTSGGQVHRKEAIKRGSLALARPELAAEWNRELNDRTAEQVAAGSYDFGWWNCPVGHDPYKTRIVSRSRGTGCPVCGHLRRVSHLKTYEGPTPGRSLAELRPDVATFWDVAGNELTPYDVAPYSLRVVKWICAAGHHFEKPVGGMTMSISCKECREVKREARKQGQ